MPSAASRVGIRELPKRLGPKKVSVARLPVTGSDLFGREEDVAFLDAAWADKRVNVVTIVAWAGVGKSTLVNHWLRRMAAEKYRSAKLVFGWSFYRQGTPSAFKDARKAVEAKTRFRKDGRRGYAGGNLNPNSLFSSLVYDRDNGVPMVHNPGRRKCDYPRLESRWRVGRRQHSVRLREFEDVMLRLLPDLDWHAIASESDDPEVKQAQAELDAVLSEIDRRKGRLVSLERLVAEGSFSRSLFESLDAEKLALGDLSAREEKLTGTLSEARSKAAALHDPAALLAAIRSGAARLELRLRLKVEIHKRIKRIELSFGGNVYTADGVVPDDDGDDTGKKQAVARLVFVNGAARYAMFGRKGGRAVAYGELLRGRLFDGVWTENKE